MSKTKSKKLTKTKKIKKQKIVNNEPKTKKKLKNSSGIGEQVRQKSPAEFFADNQNIAGFDNPGKSLYTTIRVISNYTLF